MPERQKRQKSHRKHKVTRGKNYSKRDHNTRESERSSSWREFDLREEIKNIPNMEIEGDIFQSPEVSDDPTLPSE